MTLRLRRLRIRSKTGVAELGFDWTFAAGLNVLRAPNNSGKSTVLQSIMFALGLEGGFTSKRQVPMPYVMTDSAVVNAVLEPVTEAYVILEVENNHGQVLTVQRFAKSETFDSNLVFMWEGPRLTEPSLQLGRRELFVRERGAARDEAGFHRLLTQFLDWDLPTVATFSGSDVPLYVETLVPFFYVEQKTGWSGVDPRMPTYLGIPDMTRKAAQFLLGFQALERDRKRQILRERVKELSANWKTEIASLEAYARSFGCLVSGTPHNPVSLDDQFQPQLFAIVEGSTRPIDSVIRELEVQLAELATVPSSNEQTADRELARDLRVRQESLRTLQGEAAAYLERISAGNAELAALVRRKAEVEEDRRRQQDIKTLRRLGSEDPRSALSALACPTCFQSLEPVESGTTGPILGEDDTINLLNQQLQAFRELQAHIEADLESTSQLLNAVRRQIDDTQREIRAIKDTLIAPTSYPSIAVVQQRLNLERRLHELGDLDDRRELTIVRLQELERQFTHALGELAALGDADLTPHEQAKLIDLQRNFKEQLGEFGFSSLPVDEVTISADTLRPSHEGFDLGFNLSASDTIRTKWAYFLSFLEVAERHDTNHPRILIFDEPRQQEASELSLRALINRAGQESVGSQIIFASSQTSEALEDALRGVSHSLKDAGEGLLLRPQR